MACNTNLVKIDGVGTFFRNAEELGEVIRKSQHDTFLLDQDLIVVVELREPISAVMVSSMQMEICCVCVTILKPRDSGPLARDRECQGICGSTPDASHCSALAKENRGNRHHACHIHGWDSNQCWLAPSSVASLWPSNMCNINSPLAQKYLSIKIFIQIDTLRVASKK